MPTTTDNGFLRELVSTDNANSIEDKIYMDMDETEYELSISMESFSIPNDNKYITEDNLENGFFGPLDDKEVNHLINTHTSKGTKKSKSKFLPDIVSRPADILGLVRDLISWHIGEITTKTRYVIENGGGKFSIVHDFKKPIGTKITNHEERVCTKVWLTLSAEINRKDQTIINMRIVTVFPIDDIQLNKNIRNRKDIQLKF